MLTRVGVASTLMAQLLVWVLIAIPGAAAGVSSFSRSDFPCSTDEKWIYGSQISKSTRELLEHIDHNKEAAIQTLLTGYELQAQRNTNEELKALSEFIVYRGYFDLGLLHFAYRGFNALAMTPSKTETDGIRLAALGCLNKIHRLYPSMRLSTNLPAAFAGTQILSIWPDQRKQLWEALISIVLRKFSDQGRSADVTSELHLLEHSGAFLTFTQVNSSAIQEIDNHTEFYTNQLLNTRPFPESLESQKDALRLNLARSYYNQGNFKKAVQYFQDVKQDSNLFVQAILGKAWANLQLGNTSDAVSAAYNLTYGDLKNTFVPDASVIATIAFLESCHYPEAHQNIQYFRKTYDKSYQWLYNWYTQGSRTPQGQNLYALIVKSMIEKKKTDVPQNIMSEWIRSPVFLGWQNEINLLFDERQLSKKLLADLAASSKQTGQPRRTIQLKSSIQQFITHFTKEIPQIQINLINSINHELGFLNRYLIARWLEAFENIQLIQVEMYSSTAESIIKTNGSMKNSNSPKFDQPKQIKRDQEGLVVLDWGRFPSDNDEGAETWQDEIGFLKTDVTNICPKK